MSVKRYEPNVYEVLGGQYECEMSEDNHGDYVLHSDYAELEARHNALAEECDNLKDHNQYLEACLEDRNAEMMRHVRMYETLREAVAWERETDECGEWLHIAWWDNPKIDLLDIWDIHHAARTEVDRLLQEPPC